MNAAILASESGVFESRQQLCRNLLLRIVRNINP